MYHTYTYIGGGSWEGTVTDSREKEALLSEDSIRSD